jgi:hypothetical protein
MQQFAAFVVYKSFEHRKNEDRCSTFKIHYSILSANLRLVLSVPHQTNSRKEKQQRYNTNYNQCSGLAMMINNINTGVNKSDDTEHGKYGSESTF